MSIYSPPTENVAIFDSALFNAGDEFITQSQADKRYLRFPNAQGTENLQAINVNGLATFNANVDFQSSVLTLVNNAYINQGATNTTPNNFGLSSFNGTATFAADANVRNILDIQDISTPNTQHTSLTTIGNTFTMDTFGTTPSVSFAVNGSNYLSYNDVSDVIQLNADVKITDTTNSTDISQNGSNLVITNNVNNGDIFIQAKDAGGTTKQPVEISSDSVNITGTGLGNIALTASNISQAKQIFFTPANAQGAYGPSALDNESTILAKGSAKDNSTMVLSSWSDTYNAVKVNSTSISMGVGGLTTTPTNSIVVNGSTNTTTTAGTNLSIQNTNVSFTSTTPPTSSQTIPAANDSSTKIPTTAWVQSAIAAISPSTQFVPRFANYSDNQVVSGLNYSNGTRINFTPDGGSGGGWGINDIVFFRITSQVSFDPNAGSGNAYTSTGNTSGILYFRPYYFFNGWAPATTTGGSVVRYAQNNPASICAADRHPCFYLPSFNIGAIQYFYLNNGGLDGCRVSVYDLPTTYSFFASIEYLGGRFSPGCGITFSNGNDANGVNNYLPL